MASLRVFANLRLEEAIPFLMRGESPLSLNQRIGNFFTYRARRTNTDYAVSSFGLMGSHERVARELQFQNKVIVATGIFKPFPELVISSTRDVVDYFLDNGVACYVVLGTERKYRDIIVGGYNPSTDVLIGSSWA